jgi:transketolase
VTPRGASEDARGVPTISAVPRLELIPPHEFARVAETVADRDARLALLADMCRFNALTAVKRAGSGHLGSTFSSLDVVTHLLWETLNVSEAGFDSPDRDVFFSSKGHDVPGLYAALNALGVVPTERLLRLRRLGGLDGHPDVGVPGIEANSGSLGMGISKARGIAWAKRFLGRGGQVVVMTGDGELQEGQNWEALQAAAHQRVGRLLVIVDRNELQSDRRTEEILAIESLEGKLRAFGCRVATCDGHDNAALRSALHELREGDDGTPGVLLARTIKGRGVSFMEHPTALAEGDGTYRWHAGAPDDETFERAAGELRARVGDALADAGLAPVETEAVPPLDDARGTSLQGEPESGAGAPAARTRVSEEYVARAYGEALLELAAREPRLVVLDADLASDCRVRAFEVAEPDRFVENGIAEQDMVSMAAGMARHGLVPVVNSFASFLAARANEQIYNQASEGTKVVYAMHYAGLVPAGPGKSHQSLRDASLMAAIPGICVVHPCNAAETRALVEWAVLESGESVALRLAIGPSPRLIELPDGYLPSPGVGVTLREGKESAIVAYGPVMLHEALTASELLAGRGMEVGVVAMPWLDRVDLDWLAATFSGVQEVLVVEDHAPVGALGDTLRRAFAALPEAPLLSVAGVEGWPACGTPVEALRHHGLDGASLADRVALPLSGRARP